MGGGNILPLKERKFTTCRCTSLFLCLFAEARQWRQTLPHAAGLLLEFDFYSFFFFPSLVHESKTLPEWDVLSFVMVKASMA